jgi:hypothetical protein
VPRASNSLKSRLSSPPLHLTLDADSPVVVDFNKRFGDRPLQERITLAASKEFLPCRSNRPTPYKKVVPRRKPLQQAPDFGTFPHLTNPLPPRPARPLAHAASLASRIAGPSARPAARPSTEPIIRQIDTNFRVKKVSEDFSAQLTSASIATWKRLQAVIEKSHLFEDLSPSTDAVEATCREVLAITRNVEEISKWEPVERQRVLIGLKEIGKISFHNFRQRVIHIKSGFWDLQRAGYFNRVSHFVDYESEWVFGRQEEGE